VTEHTIEGSRAPCQLIRFPEQHSVGKIGGLRIVTNVEIDRMSAAPWRSERVERPCRRLKELNQVQARNQVYARSVPPSFRSVAFRLAVGRVQYIQRNLPVVLNSHNPEVAGSNPAPVINFTSSRVAQLVQPLCNQTSDRLLGPKPRTDD
jgi:hypothetical protein